MLTRAGKTLLATSLLCLLLSLALLSFRVFVDVLSTLGLPISSIAPNAGEMHRLSLPLMFLGALLLSSILISYAHARAAERKIWIRVEREIAPDRVFAGDYVTVTVRIRNESLVHLDCVTVSDVFPDVFELALGDNVFVTSLPPRSQAEFSYVLRTTVRGAYRIGPTVLVIRDSAGLFAVKRTIEHYTEVVVYPTYEPVRRMTLLQRAYGGLLFGAHRVREKGHGFDFWSLREYQPGDPLKLIDWKATARTCRLMVKEYEAEKNIKIYIVVDCSHTMGSGQRMRTKLDYVVDGAVLLAYLAYRARDLFGLVLFSDRIHRFIKAGRSRRHFLEVLDALARARPSGPSVLMLPLRSIVLRDKRHAVVFILTDLEGDPELIESSIRYAVAHKLKPIVIACVSPAFEVSPDELSPVEREMYEALMADYMRRRAEIKQRLWKYRVPVIDVTPTDVIPAVIEMYFEAKRRGYGAT